MKAGLVLLLVPALLAGCLGGQPAVQDVPVGRIDGAVVDHLLNPFANQTVHLVQLERIDQTSPLGGFTFHGVPPGFYTLTTTSMDGITATQVVEVKADDITRIILQIFPLPKPVPYFQAYPFESASETPEAGGDCQACSWDVPLAADRPAEVTLEAVWRPSPLLGEDRDRLGITVRDDRGFVLYDGDELASPAILSIDGADIHPDAASLHVSVTYGSQFLPGTEFTMRSVMTLYHGATKAQLFSGAV